MREWHNLSVAEIETSKQTSSWKCRWQFQKAASHRPPKCTIDCGWDWAVAVKGRRCLRVRADCVPSGKDQRSLALSADLPASKVIPDFCLFDVQTTYCCIHALKCVEKQIETVSACDEIRNHRRLKRMKWSEKHE